MRQGGSVLVQFHNENDDDDDDDDDGDVAVDDDDVMHSGTYSTIYNQDNKIIHV